MSPARGAVAAMLLICLPLLQVGAQASEAPWLEGPGKITEGMPSEGGRHMRVLLEAVPRAGADGLEDLPAMATVDIAEVLRQAGYPQDPQSQRLQGFRLEPDSFTLREVSPSGQPVSPDRVPLDVFLGDLRGTTPFDPEVNPVVTVRWIMEGASTRDAPRYFHLYFDAEHNGPVDPVAYPPRDAGRLAASVGPGHGTRLYIALHDLPGAQGSNEQRTVRVTATHGPTTVRVHEYNRFGVPNTAASELDLAAAGAVATYTLGRAGADASNGMLMLEADRPFTAEALTVGAVPSTFLPARDGGLVGRLFLATPPAGVTWSVVCASTIAACEFDFLQADGGASHTVPPGESVRVQVAGGVPASVAVHDGEVAVQRLGTGVTAWPPLDGPRAATTFSGYAESTDSFFLSADGTGASLRVQSMSGSRPVLDSSLALPGRSLEGKWDRPWSTGKAHTDGPVLVRDNTGRGGVHVASGDLSDPVGHGAHVPLQSPDGGLTYTAYVPSDGQGRPMGGLRVFALFGGTTVHALRERDGFVEAREPVGPMIRDETVEIEGSGLWTIQADKPVVVIWTKRGTTPYGGLAGGITDAVEVDVLAGEATGRLLEISLGEQVVLAQPGTVVKVPVTVHNRGRTVDGGGEADTVDLDVSGNVAWPNVLVFPSVLDDIPPGGSGEATLRVKVPSDTDVSRGGVDFLVEATSRGNPGMVVDTPLRINFVVHRDVEVAADDELAVARRTVAAGEVADYEVEVRNLGSVADAFRLEISPPTSLWEMEVTPLYDGAADETPRLNPGEAARLLVTAQPVGEGAVASRLVTNVLATSLSDASVNDDVRLVSSVDTDRAFRATVDEPTVSVAPGGTAEFRIHVANLGDANEELVVNTTSIHPPGWPPMEVEVVGLADLEDIDNTFSLDPLGSVDLVARQHVPADAEPLSLALDRFRFTSAFDPDVSAEVPLRSIAAAVRGFDATLTPETLAGAPGQVVNFTLRIESAGNVPQRIDVDARVSSVGSWSVRGQEAPSAWNVSLPPAGAVDVPVEIRIPADAPPADATVSTITLRLTAPAAPTRELAGVIQVARRVAASPEGDVSYIDAGRTNTVPVAVVNEGNVPLDLAARFEDLPSGWSGSSGEARVPVGGRAVVEIPVTVPAGAAADSTATLVLASADETLLRSEWSFLTGDPVLRVALEGIEPFGGDLHVYRVVVGNDGDAPARDVSVLLLGDGQEVDRAVFPQMLPGAASVVNLVGGRGDGMEVRVVAAHDPEGTGPAMRVALDDPADRRSPAAGAAVLLILLAGAASPRRWRR